MRLIGSGYHGSPSLMNSGEEGNYQIITSRPNNFYRSYYKFEFSTPTELEVTVKINNGDPICLPSGYFSTEPYDSPIWSFVVVTPSVDFYWTGGY